MYHFLLYLKVHKAVTVKTSGCPGYCETQEPPHPPTLTHVALEASDLQTPLHFLNFLISKQLPLQAWSPDLLTP